MSEPSSVFTRVKISKTNFDAYFSSNIKDLNCYDDWTLINSDIAPYLTDIKFRGARTVAEWLTIIVTDQELWARTYYDPTEEEFQFIAFSFSDHSLDFVEALHVLRSIADYKDRDASDFAIVYSYFFDGHIDGICKIDVGSSRLLPHNFNSDEFKDFKEIAEEELNSLMNEIPSD